jgi:hypothetical protein
VTPRRRLGRPVTGFAGAWCSGPPRCESVTSALSLVRAAPSRLIAPRRRPSINRNVSRFVQARSVFCRRKLGVGLAVHILLSKYDDHVALYTLERIFANVTTSSFPASRWCNGSSTSPACCGCWSTASWSESSKAAPAGRRDPGPSPKPGAQRQGRPGLPVVLRGSRWRRRPHL